MPKTNLSYILIGLLFGIICGFAIANNHYRSLKVKGFAGNTAQAFSIENTSQKAPDKLSHEEIKNVLAQANAEPKNWQKQRNLGIALAAYSIIEQDIFILKESLKLLERAKEKIDSTDTEFWSIYGKALLAKGRKENDKNEILAARAAFKKASVTKPLDSDLKSGLAQTFIYDNPSEASKGLQILLEITKNKPDEENVLEATADAYLKLQQTVEAEKFLNKLESVNPKNLALIDLRIRLAQQKVEKDK
jgi:tetratricopeptide (TPR) repeat protein